MLVKQIIQESVNKNPIGLKETLQEELRARVAEALEAKINEAACEDDDNDGKVVKTGQKFYKQSDAKKWSDENMKEEIDQIDEISKKTLGSYIKKASDRVAGNEAEYRSVHSGADSKRGTFQDRLAYKKQLNRDTAKRKAGMDKAIGRLTKEEKFE